MPGIRRAFSDAFVFGRSANARAHGKVEKRLAECLPAADWPVYDDNGDLKAFNGWHVFGSETARNHFIKHALILLSHNGHYDLSNLNFDNFFARSYDKTGVIWYTASIVVTAPGDYRIRRSIVASRAGTTKTAAFQLLMLDVETKLDAVLRGKVASDRDRPSKQNKRKGSAPAVSIIATPLEAMAPPKLNTDDCDTWSGAPMVKSPSNASTRSPKTSLGASSSQRSKASESSQSTAPSVRATPKMAHKASMAALSGAGSPPKHAHHERTASTPLNRSQPLASPTRKIAKHQSQQMLPRAATAPPPQTLLKTLPPLPKPSIEKLRRNSMDKPPLTDEPAQIHPALRDKSHSTEGLKPTPTSDVSGASSVYSRSPVSPMDDTAAKRMQPLHIIDNLTVVPQQQQQQQQQEPEPVEAGPSPMHFEKPVSQVPARFLKQVAAFEIYV